ncbi:MAG: septum formation family protein [Acidimicrobiia bacterium]|nr:septum formation family protein [Acidimicrobiia bacterium]
MRKRTTAAALGAVAVLVLAAAGCSDKGNVFSLEEGSCFQDPDTLEVSDVETVDCEDPHFAEVFHTEDIESEGDDFPGAAVIGQAVAEACQGSAFEDFTGVPYDQDSVFDVFALSPTEETWDAGDREIACSVVSLEGEQLTGSAEGEGVPFEEGVEPPAEEGGVVPPAGEAGEPDQPPSIADPELEALAQECLDGSGTACDDLYVQTELGSVEEEYGATCGGRFDSSPGSCATAIGE